MVADIEKQPESIAVDVDELCDRISKLIVAFNRKHDPIVPTSFHVEYRRPVKGKSEVYLSVTTQLSRKNI